MTPPPRVKSAPLKPGLVLLASASARKNTKRMLIHCVYQARMLYLSVHAGRHEGSHYPPTRRVHVRAWPLGVRGPPPLCFCPGVGMSQSPRIGERVIVEVSLEPVTDPSGGPGWHVLRTELVQDTPAHTVGSWYIPYLLLDAAAMNLAGAFVEGHFHPDSTSASVLDSAKAVLGSYYLQSLALRREAAALST